MPILSLCGIGRILRWYNVSVLKNIIILFLLSLLAFFLVSTRGSQETIRQNTVNDSYDDTIKKEAVGKSLDLSNKGIDKLPPYVLDNTSLEELDISANKLTGALPAEIRRLKNLKVLDASDNKMTGVPAEIGQLEKLEVLDLSNNQLTGLPYEMGNLKSLKTLDLSGNDYATQDLEIIKQGLPADVKIIL